MLVFQTVRFRSLFGRGNLRTLPRLRDEAQLYEYFEDYLPDPLLVYLKGVRGPLWPTHYGLSPGRLSLGWWAELLAPDADLTFEALPAFAHALVFNLGIGVIKGLG